MKGENSQESTAIEKPNPNPNRQKIGGADKPLANMADLVEKNWESIE